MPGQIFQRTLLALLLVTVAGCNWPASAPPTQRLPTRATPDDVGVIDNVGVVEERGSVDQQTLTSPVTGMLYEPVHQSEPVPAVLFLGGSEGYSADMTAGGLSDLARHLAAQGFVTLQLCYFDCAERPQFLDRIPLEYVLSAVSYLSGLHEVAANSVNVFGWSRGAELALLVGSYSQNVRSVISVYGSPWAFGGLSGLGLSGTPTGDCAWTMNNACIPVGTPIPVQQIQGPVLIFHGQYDALWPMAYSEAISDELNAAQHPHALTVFANVGHTFGSLNCLIGAESCRGSRGPLVSIDWDASATVNATRIMFAQVLALLRSQAAGTSLELPTVAAAPAGLVYAAEPSAPPTPAGSPGAVLLRDTMQNPTAGLLPNSTDDPARYTRGYADGKYVISLQGSSNSGPGQVDQVVTPVPGTYTDATLSIDARLVDPSPDQFVALNCRSQADGSGYRFGIVPYSGQLSLTRWIGTLNVALFTPVLEPSLAIHTGAGTNTLELRCQADRIEGRINGSAVWSVSDYTFRAGGLSFDVGRMPQTRFGASPMSSDPVQFELSNLLVTQLIASSCFILTETDSARTV